MRQGANSHAHGRDAPRGGCRAIMRWITTTNRKDVGTRRLDFGRTTFFVDFSDIAGESLFSQPRLSLWS